MYRTLADFAVEIIRSFKLDLDWFDIGGGFYGGGAGQCRRLRSSTCAPFERPSATPATQLTLSSSSNQVVRWCARQATTLAALSIVKDIVDEHYVVTELSRINIDHEMKKTSYVHEMVTGAQETFPRQIICGYTCMDSDRLFTAHDEPALRVGDAVVIRYAGAYSMSFTPAVLHRIPAGGVRHGARRPADAVARTLERATAERLIITFQHSAVQ